jgi:pimeloyl-ACP methyl ester carboxylesterase
MLDLEVISRYPKSRNGVAPLLFIHGAFCGAWIWDEYFLPYCASRGFEAHALSLRGHGASEGRNLLPLASLDDYACDLAQVVESFDRPPVLIGHSLGGMVVQKFLRERTAPAAVLMASGPPQGMLPSTVGMFLRDPVLFLQLCTLQSGGPDTGSPDILRRLIFSKEVPELVVQRCFSRMQMESLRVGIDLNWPMMPSSTDKSKMPIMVCGGKDDYFISPVMVRATARAFGVPAEIFPNMAHAMMVEPSWRAVADHMLGWLESTLTTTKKTVQAAG